MVTRKNKKTAFVATTTPAGLGIAYVMPVRGSRKVAQQLTLSEGKKRITLNGAELRSLSNVVNKARSLADR
jgi:hypothetical protein